MLQLLAMPSLSHIQHLILDMDGVLWLGDTPIPGLPHFFELMHQLGIGFVLATNNATSTPEMYVDKLSRFGVTVDSSHIITSATATASYLVRHYPPETTIYVVGGTGIFEALRDANFVLINDNDQGKSPDLVVMGLDKEINYEKLCRTALYVAQGARFIGTNPDPSYPSERGELPGAGALQAAITATTGVEPLNVGKPGAIMFEEGLRRMNCTIENTLMVGDRLTTDIDGAHAIGMQAALVLSGVTGANELANSRTRPQHVLPTITDLGVALKESRKRQEKT